VPAISPNCRSVGAANIFAKGTQWSLPLCFRGMLLHHPNILIVPYHEGDIRYGVHPIPERDVPHLLFRRSACHWPSPHMCGWRNSLCQIWWPPPLLNYI